MVGEESLTSEMTNETIKVEICVGVVREGQEIAGAVKCQVVEIPIPNDHRIPNPRA